MGWGDKSSVHFEQFKDFCEYFCLSTRLSSKPHHYRRCVYSHSGPSFHCSGPDLAQQSSRCLLGLG